MSFFVQWFTRDEVNFLDNHSDISKMINVRINYPIEILSYLYIKSFWNNFKNMSSLVLAYDDILIVPEISARHFLFPGFHHTFWLDINRRSGSLLVYGFLQ